MINTPFGNASAVFYERTGSMKVNKPNGRLYAARERFEQEVTEFCRVIHKRPGDVAQSLEAAMRIVMADRVLSEAVVAGGSDGATEAQKSEDVQKAND